MVERSDRAVRRAERAARRDERSGAGPAAVGHDPGRMPGAIAPFALFGEVLFAGILVTVLSLPLVTIPLAFAAGVRHLRRFLRGESSTLAVVAEDVAPRTILRSLPAGLALLAVTVALTADLLLGYAGAVPGSGAVIVVGWLGLALVACTLLTAARRYDPERGWLDAVRGCAGEWRGDPAAVLYLLAALVFVVVVGWQLLPLVVPGIGCLVLAVVALPERPRRRAQERGVDRGDASPRHR